MLEGAWPELYRTLDSETLPGGGTGSAIPVASRPLRYRPRFQRRVPNWQESLRQSEVLCGGGTAGPSTVPHHLRLSVATAHRRHVPSVPHRARDLQLWFWPLSAPTTETTTDLRAGPSDHPGKRRYLHLAAASGAAVRSDYRSLREAKCLGWERIDHRNQSQGPDGVPSFRSKQMSPTFARMRP